MNLLAAALKETRKSKGIAQSAVANVAGIDRTALSRIENQKVAGDPVVIQRIIHELDCARLYKEAHETLASMVFVHRWLDGEGVDLHRSSVKAKTLEELAEAIDALKGFDLVNKPANVTDEDREQLVKELLFPLLGAEGAIEKTIAILCEEYGVSLREVYERWNKRQEDKGYQSPRNPRTP